MFSIPWSTMATSTGRSPEETGTCWHQQYSAGSGQRYHGAPSPQYLSDSSLSKAIKVRMPKKLARTCLELRVTVNPLLQWLTESSPSCAMKASLAYKLARTCCQKLRVTVNPCWSSGPGITHSCIDLSQVVFKLSSLLCIAYSACLFNSVIAPLKPLRCL